MLVVGCAVEEEAALQQALHSEGARCRRRDVGVEVETMTGAGNRDNEAGLDVEMGGAVRCSAVLELEAN